MSTDNFSGLSRNILKGILAMGSIQVFQMLISLVRGKLVAMILGPYGLGISAIYRSTSENLTLLGSLGLNLAVVREVAALRDDSAFSRFWGVCFKLFLFSALLGGGACVLLSPWLSLWGFGSYEYTPDMILLGVAVFLMILQGGYVSMLQGLQKLKAIAKVTLAGGACGLLVGVPLYYLWGIRGIVPGILALSLTQFLFSRHYVKGCGIEQHPDLRLRDELPRLGRLMRQGVMLVCGSLTAALVAYFFNLFIKDNGSTVELGLYQGANSITLQYSGMLFTALLLDYLPRLSAYVNDNRAMTGVVNCQARIVALLVAPAVSLVLLFAHLLVQVLLTPEFYDCEALVRLMAVSIAFKALGAPLSYIALVKSNNRVYFWLEVVTVNLLMLLGGCGCFLLWGLNGIGINMVVNELLCLLIYYAVNRRLYGVRFEKKTFRSVVLSILPVLILLAASFAVDGVEFYVISGVVIAAVLAHTLLNLRRVLLEKSEL